MKKFKFRNAEMTIEPVKYGYGQYKLSGLGTNMHCTNSFIYDYCNSDECTKSKQKEARKEAYDLLKNIAGVWKSI